MDTIEKLDLRSKRALEWERLKTYVASQALSVVSREKCLNLPLFDDADEVETALSQTEEALSLLENRSNLLAYAVPDVTEILVRLSSGSKLLPDELLSIKEVLSITQRVVGSLRLLSEETFPTMTRLSSKLVSLPDLRQEIEKCIDEKGAIKDDASSELKSIRKGIKKLHAGIKEELGKLIHTPKVEKALQEVIVTQRNGRYVIPVSSNKREAVNGIVHDTSQSGLTVYIEPISVVEPTNKIRLLEAQEEQEIERILIELSAQCKTQHPLIQADFETLTEIDIIQSRAKLAHKYSGVKPDISNSDEINLEDSRHPLLVLQGDHVIANSISLGGGDRTLVITGPNTGGKTVLLKQIGLLSIMVKAGLLIPAKPGCSMPVFKNIWADIGDEQSLEASLSTFSSHLQNVVSIVNDAEKGILILLDEIGVGTDPKEGAAIAHAVLKHLNGSGALTVTTTHYTDLKLLAYTEDGFVNGSLEFDEATFAPTYKLRVGVPGSSKGIVIAERLGLNFSVTEVARQLIESHEDRISELMLELESRLEQVSKIESDLEQKRFELDSKRKELEELRLELQSSKEEIEKGYRERLKADFETTEQKIKSLTRSLQRKPSLKKVQAVKERLEEIRKDAKWVEKELPAHLHEDRLTLKTARVGQRVKVLSLNQTGTIEEIASTSKDDSTFNALVQCGSVKVKVTSDDLKLVPGASTQIKSKTRSYKKPRAQKKAAQKSMEPRDLDAFIRTQGNTIDLRGKRVEEALDLVDKFMDECLVSSVTPIMIIHGHGTGAVKQAVRQYLKSSKYCREFRPGEMYEGGDGVTVAFLS